MVEKASVYTKSQQPRGESAVLVKFKKTGLQPSILKVADKVWSHWGAVPNIQCACASFKNAILK